MRARVLVAAGLAPLVAGSLAWATAGGRQGPAGCSPALVRYEQNWDAGGALARMYLPWVAAGPGKTRLVGHLWSHTAQLGDGRINRSDGFVVPAGVPQKILWSLRGGARASRLEIAGRRLDGVGSFRSRFGIAGGGTFPSELTIPSAGCWRLTLRSGPVRRTLDVRAVPPAPDGRCDASPVRNRSVRLTPSVSSISALWLEQAPDGGALLHPHGRLPTGEPVMKVPWSSTRTLGGMLHVRGTRLDGPGTFRQSFAEAFSPRGFWPSGVIVPETGCWLLTVRITGTPPAAGVLVARAGG